VEEHFNTKEGEFVSQSETPLAAVHFTEVGPEIVNGAAKSVQLTVNEQLARGYLAVIVAPAHSEAMIDPLVMRVPSLPLGRVKDYRISLPFLSLALWWKLAVTRFDVYHVHHLFLLGIFARVVSWLRGVPCIATYHTYMVEYVHYVPFLPRWFKQRLVIWWSRTFLNWCDGVVAPSEWIATKLRGYGVRVPIEVVPTGIRPEALKRMASDEELKRFDIDPDEFKYVTVSRLAAEKNTALVVRAFARAMRLTDRWLLDQLVIIGDGPLRRELTALARELGITSCVRFTGQLCNEQAWAIAGRCDLFVYASTTETQGLVHAEAAEKGLAQVAVGAGAVSHQGATVCLVDNDEISLAQGMCELRRNPKERQRLAMAGRSANRSFWIHYTIPRLLTFYREVICQHQNGA